MQAGRDHSSQRPARLDASTKNSPALQGTSQSSLNNRASKCHPLPIASRDPSLVHRRGSNHNLWLRRPASYRVKWSESLFCSYFSRRIARGCPPSPKSDSITAQNSGNRKIPAKTPPNETLQTLIDPPSKGPMLRPIPIKRNLKPVAQCNRTFLLTIPCGVDLSRRNRFGPRIASL